MSKKRIIFNVVLFAFSGMLAAFGVYMIYLHLNASFLDLFLDLLTGIRNQRLLYAVLLLVFAIYPALAFSRSKPVRERKTVTVVNCYGCNYREVRAFQKGDYVFKKLGACNACNSEQYISAIYSVPLTKVEEKEESL
ncbi:MAG: hypothetical protein QW279_13375 [Candidatus Jordarchaeaceae archaeon]